MLIEGKHIHMGSTVEVVIYVVLLIEFILCIIGVSYQISLKLTKNLKVFYLCLLVHCVLMVGYFFDPFVEYSGITCAMLYFSANIFIENSINLMIFEWVKIIILSKTQALVTKRLHLELFSYLILCLNIFWWVVFAVLIIISLTSGADLVT